MGDERHGRDTEQMRELLDTFAEKIPVLLNSLTDAIYGKAASAKFGLAVADFYGRLKASGMTDEQAFALTEQYMSPLNLGGMIANAIHSRRNEAA